MASGGTTWQARNATSRANRAIKINLRMQTYVDQVFQNTKLSVAQKLKMVGQAVRDRTVYNLSLPVRKYKSKRTGRTVVDPSSRSKRGEYPRADSTRLLKDVFWDFNQNQLVVRVGVTLEYGLILEVKLGRSFLRRSLNEALPWISLMFTSNPSDAQIAGALSASEVVPNPGSVPQ